MAHGTSRSNTQQTTILRRLPSQVSPQRSSITQRMLLLRTIPTDDQEKATSSNSTEDRSIGYPTSNPRSRHRLQRQSSWLYYMLENRPSGGTTSLRSCNSTQDTN